MKDLNETIKYMYKHKKYQKVRLAFGVAVWGRYEEGSGRSAPLRDVPLTLGGSVFWKGGPFGQFPRMDLFCS